MEKYFLAIDIGASSGRHILGSVINGKLNLEEVYRFKNGAVDKNGKLVWDIEGLFNSVKEGLKKCKEIGKIPVSVGIDTWGVDYALLDKDDNLIDEVFSYRDERTISAMEEVSEIIPKEDAYLRTGIQPLVYNTVYQLYCDKKSGKLEKAETFLMVPDYLHFLLTGNKLNEYTNASTTGLLNAKTRDWDYEIIEKLGYPKKLFKPLKSSGTFVGNLKKEIVDYIGFDTKVCLPATHDTASAVMSVTKKLNPLYISSGTWSLIGTETERENTSLQALKDGFSNEGAYNKNVRFLKNIMGLWMIQCVKKELNDKYSFAEFVDMAKDAKGFDTLVDVNDISFFSPKSMSGAINDYCKKHNLKAPSTTGEMVLLIYRSLANGYKLATERVEKLTNKKFEAINIVGGGCQNQLLNELTAEFTGKKVVTGPIEATAIGNLIVQMCAEGTVSSIDDGKDLIAKSFDIKEI